MYSNRHSHICNFFLTLSLSSFPPSPSPPPPPENYLLPTYDLSGHVFLSVPSFLIQHQSMWSIPLHFMPDLSHVCDLHHSSQQHRILNLLSEARDWTPDLVVPSQIHFRNPNPQQELLLAHFSSLTFSISLVRILNVRDMKPSFPACESLARLLSATPGFPGVGGERVLFSVSISLWPLAHCSSMCDCSLEKWQLNRFDHTQQKKRVGKAICIAGSVFVRRNSFPMCL